MQRSYNERNELTSLVNSDDHVFIVRIFSLGIHLLYIWHNFCTASIPSGVCSPPIKIRSGFNKSLIADPSAKNSGFERTYLKIKNYTNLKA